VEPPISQKVKSVQKKATAQPKSEGAQATTPTRQHPKSKGSQKTKSGKSAKSETPSKSEKPAEIQRARKPSFSSPAPSSFFLPFLPNSD
jgi:hypothetical protein